jgi:hypothetical protein
MPQTPSEKADEPAANPSVDDDLAEARRLLDLLGRNLPTEISVRALGVREKAPYNLLSVRESLAWRTEELGRNACALLERDDLAAGALLTRAITESAAFIFRLKDLLDTRATRELSEMHDTVVRMGVGWKGDPEFPEAVNILTLVGRMEKKIPGTRKAYDSLSEFAHPNWSGVAGLFAENDHEKFLTRFGRGWEKRDYARQSTANLLVASLHIFCSSYNEISEELPNYLAELTPL